MSSIGKWRLNNIDDTELSLTVSQDIVSAADLEPEGLDLHILDGDKSHIATVKVLMKRQKLTDGKSALSEVGFQLYAEMPLGDGDKTDKKVWNRRVRDGMGKENEKYTLGRMQLNKTRLEMDLKNSRLAKDLLSERWTEDGKFANDDKGTRKGDDSVRALMESSKAFAKEKSYEAIVNLVNGRDTTLSPVNRTIILAGIDELEDTSTGKLELTEKQIAWRNKMDELTSRLEANSSLSATVWYECLVDKKNEEVVLAEVTTEIPPSSKGSGPSDLKANVEMK